MMRIAMLVGTMMVITYTPEALGALSVYKDYILAILLSLLFKPWLEYQFD